MAISFFESYLERSGYHIGKARVVFSELKAKLNNGDKAFFEKKRWEIVTYHFEHNAFYRQKLKDVLPASWNEIPELLKSDLQEGIEKLLSKPYTKKEVYISNTSGSSGTPFFYAKDKFSHALTWALIESRYAAYGIGLNDLQARFYGIPLKGMSAFKERMKDRIMNRRRFPVFDLSDEAFEKHLEVFRQKKFKYVYGYTNSILLFCRFLLRRGIVLKELCPTLKCTIVTSEMCTEQDKVLIGKATGTVCVPEYGASEFGIISFMDKDGLQRISEELLFVETNEHDEVLITGMFNKAFPFIRYNIGDKCRLFYDDKGRLCIDAILGRSDDTIQLPNGKIAAGLTMYYCSRRILESFANIKEIYFTQTGLDAFNVYYISDKELDASQKEIINEAFDTYLCKGLNVAFHRTNQIRRKANGKFQLFTSLLQ